MAQSNLYLIQNRLLTNYPCLNHEVAHSIENASREPGYDDHYRALEAAIESSETKTVPDGLEVLLSTWFDSDEMDERIRDAVTLGEVQELGQWFLEKYAEAHWKDRCSEYHDDLAIAEKDGII